MASIEGFTVSMTDMYRPCIVDRQHKALFHRWSECSEIIKPSIMRGGHAGGIIKYPCAIVEYEDGTVHEHSPSVIRFLDSAEAFEEFKSHFAIDAEKSKTI